MTRTPRRLALWFWLLSLAAPSWAGDARTDLLAVGRALLSYDAALPLKPEMVEKPIERGMKVMAVKYNSLHGERVPALLWLPETATGKLPCVVLQHGLGGSKETMKTMAEALCKQGYACFAIDARYHGERPRSLSLLNLMDYPFEVRDAFAQTAVDLRRAVDYLTTREDIDASRIGYMGFSMGAIIGSFVTAVEHRYRCPILVVGGGDWDTLLAKTILPLTSSGGQKDAGKRRDIVSVLAPLDPLLWVGQIAPQPVFLINGDADDIVPVPCGKALQQAAAQPKKTLWYKGKHNAPPDMLKKEAAAWFDEHLKGVK